VQTPTQSVTPHPVRPAEFPPGPSALRYVSIYCQEGFNFLRLAKRLFQTYGDIVHVKVGHRHHYYFNHPAHIEQVLLAGYALRTSRPPTMRHALGQGIITSQGELHRTMRGLIQPFFLKPAMVDKALMIVEENERLLSSWREGEARDLAEEMTHLTLAIILRTLLGTVYNDAEMLKTIRRETHTLHQFSHQNPASHINMMVENQCPFARGRTRAGKAKRFLDDLVYREINRRRAAHELDGDDILGTLLRAQAAHPELRHFTDRHIRDEVMTMFLAGHETSASAIAWTWYLLSQHPEAEGRFHEELDRVLGGRLPRHEDLPNLPYTRMVFMESMRIYPPVWTLGRRPAGDDLEVGGYRIPNKSMILISPYVTQHDERFFPDPERFDPTRFTPEAEAKRSRFAYFPFAQGNRKCIGEPLALMEGILSLATIGSRWRLTLVPGHPVEMMPFIALKPKHGIKMLLERREPVLTEDAVMQATR